MNDWELYSNHKDYSKAVHAIERAWWKAIQLAPEKTSQERAQLAEQHVYKVLTHWRHVGACDTDPLWVLRNRVRKHFGCEGGWL